MTKKIIVDTDPGCDDMLALLLLCAASDVDILAVTTVAGNVPIQKTTNNAQYVLDYIGKGSVPVYSGSSQPSSDRADCASVHGKSGLGDVVVESNVLLDGRAVDKIIQLVQENPNEVTLLMLGPQTNVALAIKRAPEIMQLTKMFVIMGGAFGVPGNHNGAEFNIGFDPKSAAIVANFSVTKTYVPLDLCNKIQVPLSEFNRIRDEKIHDMVISAIAPYIRRIQENELPTKGALMYDVLAAHYLLQPELFMTKSATVAINIATGATSVVARGNAATLVMDISEARFLDNFMNIVNQSQSI